MRKRAVLLRKTGYVNAAQWCEHIRDHLNLYSKYPNDLVLDLHCFVESFKIDFLDSVEEGNRKLRQDCLEVVQVLLERAIENDANVNQTLTELLPYADRALNANKPIYQMGEAFNALDESLLEVQVYGNLFTFMLHIDGQYFPTIKILCALKLAGDGNKPTIEYIESLNLEQMESLIGEFGSPIFKIYDSVGRHLRNAVAHCNFTYSQGKLLCWDTDPRSKQITWKKEFSVIELSAIINDLEAVGYGFFIWFVIRELAEKLTRNVTHSGLQLKFKYITSNLVKEK